MNEIESKEIDYQEKELTDSIKRNAIFSLKILLITSLVMLIITLFWSLIKW